MALHDSDSPSDRYDRVTIAFHWLTRAGASCCLERRSLWNYLAARVGTAFARRRARVARHCARGGAGRPAGVAGDRRAQARGDRHAGDRAAVEARACAALRAARGPGRARLRRCAGCRARISRSSACSRCRACSRRNRALVAPDRESAQSRRLDADLSWPAAHAFAALFHRYVLKDGVLRRMLPIGALTSARRCRSRVPARIGAAASAARRSSCRAA